MLKHVTKRKRNSKIIDSPFPVCLQCKRMILLKCINIIPETKLMIEYECSCGKKFNLPFKSYNTVLQIFSNINFDFTKYYTYSCCYCITCSEFLDEKHGIEEINKGHFVIKHYINDYNENCIFHSNEEISVFCINCDQGLCLRCLSSHLNHVVKTLSEYYDYVNKTFVMTKLENVSTYADEILNNLSISNQKIIRTELIQLLNLFKISFRESSIKPNLTLIQSIKKLSFPTNLFNLKQIRIKSTHFHYFTLSEPKSLSKDIHDEIYTFFVLKNKKIILYLKRIFCYKRHNIFVFDKDFKCIWAKEFKDECFLFGSVIGNKILFRSDCRTLYLCEFTSKMKVLKKWKLFWSFSYGPLNDHEILVHSESNFIIINLNNYKKTRFTYKLRRFHFSYIKPINDRICFILCIIIHREKILYIFNYRIRQVVTSLAYSDSDTQFEKLGNYLFLPAELGEIGIMDCWDINETRLLYRFTFKDNEIIKMEKYFDKYLICSTYNNDDYYFKKKNEKIIQFEHFELKPKKRGVCIQVMSNVYIYYLKDKICALIKTFD